MKKVMTALAVAATALLAFGDVQSGTSFEDLTTGEKAINALVGHTDAGGDSGDFYWLSDAVDQTETALSISNYVSEGISTPIASRPVQFASDSNTRYLHIDVSTPLSRTINPANAEGGPAAQAIGDGIYLDTLVQFTAADQVFGTDALGTGDKIAIEYAETDDGITNFVVRAGYVGEQVTKKNYIMNPVADFDVTAWHRLTVRAIANVGSQVGSDGFVVYLDGVALTYPVSEAAGDSAYVDALNSTIKTYLYNSNTHALLPSAVAYGETGYGTLSAVAFQGNGSIDDISFTSTKPSFVVEGTTVTIAWDAGVASVTVNDGTSDIYTNSSISGQGSTDLVITSGASSLTVTAYYATGYEAGTWTVTGDGAAINDTTFTIVSGARLDIVSMIPKFQVGNVKYDSFAQAVAAAATAGTQAEPATIKLLANAAEVLNFTTGYITLDLNGKTVQGGTGADYSILNQGATLTIIDSVGGGVVAVPTDELAVGAMSVGASASVAVQAGTFDGAIIPVNGAQLTLTGGVFADSIYDPTDAESTFYLLTSVASGYEATYNNGYFTVAEKSAEPTCWADVLGDAAQDGAYEIDDLAELKDFQKYVGTFPTANVTFKLTANIALEEAWPGIGVDAGKDKTDAQYEAGAFRGTFDGDNHTISNFKMVDGVDYGGFFNSILDATVKNLKISWGASTLCSNSSASGDDTGASFVGTAKGSSTLKNLTALAGTVTTVTASKDMAGIVGYVYGGSTIDSCTNELNITSFKSSRKCGGIAVITQNGSGNAIFRNCYNSGTVTTPGTTYREGGIVGYINVATTIDGCENTANVKLFHVEGSPTVTVTGTNKGYAGVISNDKGVSGLYFATVSGDVATFVADNALAAGNTYKVMSAGATATYEFAAAGTIAFDTNLTQNVTFAITAPGLDLTDATANGVVTFTAATQSTPVTPGSDDGETYTSAEAATNAAAKVVVAVPDAVKTAGVNTDTYAAMFEAKVVSDGAGGYKVEVVLKDEIEAAIQANVDDATETALEEVLKVAADTAADVTVTTKPGLYYQIVTGNALPLAEPDSENWTMATGDSTSIQVTKPADNAAFFKVYCTPAK